MDDFIIGLLAATLRVATPLIFATLGELFCERAGILNLGIEGTMFFGAFVGFAGAAISGNLWIGVLAAAIGGILSGLLMSLMTVRLGVNQHVSGLGITLLLTALSLFGFRLIFGENRVLPSITPFKQLEIFSNSEVPGTYIFSIHVNLHRHSHHPRCLVDPLPDKFRPEYPLGGRQS